MNKAKEIKITYTVDAVCFDTSSILEKQYDLLKRIDGAFNGSLNYERITTLLGNGELTISGEENLDD